jgi:hypothetical protein
MKRCSGASWSTRAAESMRASASEEHVLGDRQVGQQGGLLAHDGHAELPGALRGDRVQQLAPDVRGSLVGRERPRDHGHQRRLAGPVLADHPVDLATLDLQRDAIQRGDAREALGDAFSAQCRGTHRLPPPQLLGSSPTS